MTGEQKAQLFTISIDAIDYDLFVGYAFDLDAAKAYAVSRPLSDYEGDYLTLEEVVNARGAWEWKERITSNGEKVNGRWTNGVETIHAVLDEKIAGQHPAVAEVVRLRMLLANLIKAGDKALALLDEHIEEWRSKAADTDVARIIIGLRQAKADALRVALSAADAAESD